MRPIDAFQTMAALAIAAAAGACATPEPADRRTDMADGRSETTAVRQAVNGSIVGCASTPANPVTVSARQQQVSPFCARKG